MVPPYNPNDPFNQPIPDAGNYGSGKKKKKLWLWITLGILIPLLLCGCGIGGCAYWAISKTKPAFDATNKFYKAATKGNDIEPYICSELDADEFMQEFEDANDELGEIRRYKFDGYQNNNGNVVISGELNRGGLSQYVEVDLVKESGKFKVCGINNDAVPEDLNN